MIMGVVKMIMMEEIISVTNQNVSIDKMKKQQDLLIC
jgi:hypothetical protein